MSVRRVMGLETEFGITQADDPTADPVLLSGLAVRAYAVAAGPGLALPTGAGWDYADETPLRDARGYEMARALADVSQLTDVDDPSVANSVLANGARLYVDHAHPEYSSPEVTTPQAALVWDRAGEAVLRRATTAATATGHPLRVYKNNVDGKGASYGTHENYLVPRALPFATLAHGLVPFLVARQVMCGAGRVGIGQRSEVAGFQLAQRADYLETEVGLETTLKRPIVNTRDEPHASAAVHRRLHLILGDANLADVAGLLKTGTTSLVLRLIEDGLAPDLTLADPVAAVRTVSRDLSLRAMLPLADGRQLSAVQLLRAYHDAVLRALDGEREGWQRDPATEEVVQRWGQVLDRLARDPMECRGELEWVTKLGLLQRYRDRDGLGWDDPRLAALDIRWSDLDPATGLAVRLRASGHLERLVQDAEVEQAVQHPPEDTRAWFRGQCVRRYPAQVRAASWDSVVFATEGRGLRRVSLPEPMRGSRSEVQTLLERHEDADGLLEELATDPV